jgi:hypothetical protein
VSIAALELEPSPLLRKSGEHIAAPGGIVDDPGIMDAAASL